MYNNKVATIEDDNRKITIWTLALPLLIQTVLSNLINTTGITVLSCYSESFVTATSVADQIISFPRLILESLVSGTVILSSISFGKGDRKHAASICGCGVTTVFALSIFVGAIVAFLAEPLVTLMNLKGETAMLCRDYLFVTALLGLPLQLIFGAFQKLLICNGHSGIIPVSSITAGALNVLLTYIVLNAADLPVSDITALGFKTSFAWLAGLGIVVAAFFKIKCPLKLNFDWLTAFKIAKIGIPAGMSLISFSLSNTITTGFLAQMGDSAVNAKIYINNIVTYVSIMFYSIALANAVIMGRHRGAGRFDDMKILFKQNLILALTINGSLSILCYLFRNPLLSIFTRDSQVLSLAGIIMLIDIPVELARGINHLSENSLNPNGDVKTTLVVSVIAAWLFTVLLGYILCIKVGLGLVGLWIGFLCTEAFKSVIYLVRWRSDRWKGTKV